MKRELKLEDIAMYLPYSLQFICPNKYKSYTTPNTIIGTIDNNIIFNRNKHKHDLQICVIKPILHPISDINKKITCTYINDGKEFIPNDYIYKMLGVRIILDIENDTLCIKYNGLPSTIFPLYKINATIVLLIIMHFDMYNLIEQDLAININNLKK